MFGGKLKYATVGDGTMPVVSLFSYKTGGNEKFFAATEGAIYNISPDAVADPDMIPSPTASGFESGDWVGAQIQTPGGTFLRLVNGATVAPL